MTGEPPIGPTLARCVRVAAGARALVPLFGSLMPFAGDWLEKRFSTVDASDWMVVARLRNKLVHEYPIEEIEQVRRLNDCWAAMPLLHEIVAALAACCGERGYVRQDQGPGGPPLSRRLSQ